MTTAALETNGDLASSLSRFNLPNRVFTTVDVGNYSPFSVSKKNHSTAFNASILYPPSFSPTLKYPVLFKVYTGPGKPCAAAASTDLVGSQSVTQTFSFGIDSVFAAQGVAVVVVDGRGTAGRVWLFLFLFDVAVVQLRANDLQVAN